jgi:Cep192 domain 4
LQSTRIASKHSSVVLLFVLSLMCVIGCGGGAGATRSNGGTPPGPTPTPSPTPVAPGSPSLAATPSSLGFGSQVINTPVTLTVKVTNNGSGAANITKDSITGTGFSTGITTPITLNPAQSMNIQVVFTPAASGSVAGSFTLSSNGVTLLSIPLSGTGLTPLAHTVDIAWSASTSASLQGYNVYRSTTTGGPYTKISPALSSTTLLFTDGTPQSGQKYFYVVTAVNASGLESTASTEVAVTIPTP